jgi:peptidoglycan/LPS O-acetylase OafA/YrhL
MRINYRPEIDGLRSIAVVAVIIYHAQIFVFGDQLFKGGFIGVDIFFVISGYLITSIILKELNNTGTFSFKNFYERRVRRLLPALLLVMIVSFPFAWSYLSPVAFIDYSKSILSSLFFSSNIYFYLTGIEYDGVGGIFKPYLHTWSLSVEEQYYIIFPIILLLSFRFYKTQILKILILIFIVSLVIAHFSSKEYATLNFYSIHSRMWELMAGSILAFFELKKGYRSNILTLNKYLPLFGLLIIFYSIIFFDNQIPHPSFYTVLPVAGVCLIIWFSGQDDLVTKILSTKIFVGVGLISYSLYIWHYPIFSFSRISDFTQGDLNKKIYIAVLLLGLSILSYIFIERPFRNKKFRFNKIIYILFSSALVVSLSSFLVIKKDGFNYDFPKNLNIENYDLRAKYPYEYKKCHKNFKINDKFCKFGNYSKDVYLVGDSQLITIMHDLKEKLNDKKFNLTVMTRPGQFLVFKNFQNKKGKKYQNYRLNHLRKVKDSTIILGGKYSLYSDYTKKSINEEIENYKKFFDEMKNNKNKIILLYPMPIVDNPYHADKISRLKIKKIKSRGLENQFILKEEFKKQSKKTYNFLKNFNHNNIKHLDLSNIFCDMNKCYSVKNEKIFISDDDHPSILGAKLINNLIIKEFN